MDDETLLVHPGTPLALLLQVVAITDFGRISDDLELLVTQPTISRALSLGLDGDKLQAQLEALAPLPDALVQNLARASTILARASFVPAVGFLWVADEHVRELLLSRRQTGDLFLDPSPMGGLLVAPGVDQERLVRRCRSLGVEITQEGRVLRGIPTTPPPPTAEPAPRRKTVPPRRGS